MTTDDNREEQFESIKRKLGDYKLTIEEIDLIGPEFTATLTEEQRGLLVKDLEAAEKDPEMQIAAGRLLLKKEQERKRKNQAARTTRKLKRKAGKTKR